MLESGDLYIRDTTDHDGSYTFRCHTENIVTKEKKVSMNYSRIIITGKYLLILYFYNEEYSFRILKEIILKSVNFKKCMNIRNADLMDVICKEIYESVVNSVVYACVYICVSLCKILCLIKYMLIRTPM